MSNCPAGYSSIHGSSLKAGQEYRYRSPFGEADVRAVERSDDSPERHEGWEVEIVNGFVKFPSTDRLAKGDMFFVRDSEKFLYEPKL